MLPRHTLRNLQVHWCSLVDEPANQDARILLWKRADPPPDADANDGATTLRAAAWAALLRLAEVERQRTPTLTPQAAMGLALTSPRGMQLYALYTGRDAGLTQAEATEKRRMQDERERLTGRRTWSAVVADLAQKFRAAYELDAGDALELVAKRAPDVYRAYLNERRA